MRRPRSEYSRVFSFAAAGLFLLVTGVIGFDVRYLRGMFAGGRWVDPPIWWQIGAGATALVLAVHWTRRLNGVRPARRVVKYVGRGQVESEPPNDPDRPRLTG